MPALHGTSLPGLTAKMVLSGFRRGLDIFLENNSLDSCALPPCFWIPVAGNHRSISQGPLAATTTSHMQNFIVQIIIYSAISWMIDSGCDFSPLALLANWRDAISVSQVQFLVLHGYHTCTSSQIRHLCAAKWSQNSSAERAVADLLLRFTGVREKVVPCYG